MSQDIEDTVNPRWVTVFSFWGGGVSGGLVVPGEVGVQFAQELAGGSVDDPGVQVVDQEQDVGPGVGPADADMAQAAAGAQGDGAVGVDGVAADAVVGVGGAVARGGFGAGGTTSGAPRVKQELGGRRLSREVRRSARALAADRAQPAHLPWRRQGMPIR